MEFPNLSSEPFLFIFSKEPFIPKLLYYSHIPGMFIALLMGVFVYLKSKVKLLSLVFFLLTTTFFLWSLFSLIAWSNQSTDIVMLAWSFLVSFASLFAFLSFYFFNLFIHGDKLSIGKMTIAFLPILPLLVFSGSNVLMQGINIENALPIQNELLMPYSFVISYFFALAVIYDANKYLKNNPFERTKIWILAGGIEIFLILFLTINAISSYRITNNMGEDYVIEPYALFGMPIFMSIIAYLIVKYEAFGIKLHEMRVLIIALIILIGSQVFFIESKSDRVFILFNFVVTTLLGYWMMRILNSDEKKKRKELEIINKKLIEKEKKLRDINQKLQRDKNIVEKANRDLQKLDHAKTEFINIASHQLRTPLTIVKGVASLLVSGKIEKFREEDKKMFYESVWSKCLKLEQIIDDILNAATFTNKKFSVMDQCARRVDLKKLILAIVKDLDQEIKKKNLSVNFQTDEKWTAIVIAQKEYLEEALINIIANAIKYTPSIKEPSKGEPAQTEKGQIVIGIKPDENDKNFLNICISDNGIGIPQNEMGNLFQRFFRAENAKNIYTDGTGLGLFIAHEIIEGHGGTIRVESEVDRGSTFIIKLPTSTQISPDIKAHLMKQSSITNNSISNL